MASLGQQRALESPGNQFSADPSMRLFIVPNSKSPFRSLVTTVYCIEDSTIDKYRYPVKLHGVATALHTKMAQTQGYSSD